MSLFPEDDYTEELATEVDDPYIVTTESTTIGRTPLYDFVNKCYVLTDGKIVECTQAQAVEQWLAFLILTKLGKFKVYTDTGFGTDIDAYVGYKLTDIAFVMSQIESEITEKAKLNRAIDYVDNFAYSAEADYLNISLTVHLETDETVEVTINV